MFEISINKKKTKNIISSLLILSIFFSMAFLTPTKAADPIQQQNQEGNNVSWQSQQNTTQESWNWTYRIVP